MTKVYLIYHWWGVDFVSVKGVYKTKAAAEHDAFLLEEKKESIADEYAVIEKDLID